MQRMAETLRGMAQPGQDARRMTQQSDQLRQQAQRMLEQMSPQQRDQAMRMAKQFANDAAKNQPGHSQPGSGPTRPGTPGQFPSLGTRNNGGTGVDSQIPGRQDATGPVASPRPFIEGDESQQRRTEAMDVRKQRENDPAARVLSQWDAAPRPDGASGGVGPSLAGGLTQAARGAQNAIEQQQVPAQYSDLVRRVFKKYVDRAAAQQSGSKPDAAGSSAEPRK
jgi:hypothetical protein